MFESRSKEEVHHEIKHPLHKQFEWNLANELKTDLLNKFFSSKLLSIMNITGKSSKPKIFISYAVEDEISSHQAKRLSTQLTNAGCEVLNLDSWEIRRGQNPIDSISELLTKCEQILVIGSAAYLSDYNRSDFTMGLFASRFNTTMLRLACQNDKAIPLLFGNNPEKSLPPLLLGKYPFDFNNDYFETLIDLIKFIYKINQAEHKDVYNSFIDLKRNLKAYASVITVSDQQKFYQKKLQAMKELEEQELKSQQLFKEDAFALIESLLNKPSTTDHQATDHQKVEIKAVQPEMKEQSYDILPLKENINIYLWKYNFGEQNKLNAPLNIVSSVCRPHQALERLSGPQFKLYLNRGFAALKLIDFVKKHLIPIDNPKGFSYSEGSEESVYIPLHYLEIFNKNLLKQAKPLTETPLSSFNTNYLPNAPGNPRL